MSALGVVDVGLAGDPAPDDDAEAVRAHLDGDPRSFDVLYRRYFPRLVRMLSRRVGDTPAAEDIAQETLLRAFNNLRRFDLDRPMWPWLKAIATNLSCDHLRRRGREPLADVEVTEGTAADDLTFSPMDDLVGAIEDRRVLALALENVPSRQRVALGLRYLDDWSPDEAADFLGVTRNGFDQLLFRARARLRAEYDALTGERGAVGGFAMLPFVTSLNVIRHWVARIRARTTGIEAGLPGVAGSGDLLMQAVAAAGVAFVVAVGALGSPASASASPVAGATPSAPTMRALHREAVRNVAATTSTRGPRLSAVVELGTADVQTPRTSLSRAVTVAPAPAADVPSASGPATPPTVPQPQPVADADLRTDDLTPAVPKTRAKVNVGRDEDGNQTLNSRLESRLGGYSPSRQGVTRIHCASDVGSLACETYDAANETLPETPPPPATDVTTDPAV